MSFIANMRLVLVLLFLVLGILLHIRLGIGSAWYLYLTSFIILVTHFLFGTVWAAFGELKKGKLNEAENLLDRIKRPEWLMKSNQAYYYFTRGMIEVQREENKSGQENLKKALKLGLRSETDNALAALRIAHANYMDKNYAEANTYLKKSQAYNSSDLMIKENLEKLGQALQRELN